jgi:hypothetical protein
VHLALPILGNDKRSCPAQNASDYPGTASPVVNDFAGCARCFDYDVVRNPVASFIRQAYINYALAVTLAVNATGALAVVELGRDANRYLEDCPDAALWASFLDFYEQAYRTLKEAYPEKAVFPSVSLESMLQLQEGQACAGRVNFKAKTAPAALAACARTGYGALAGLARDAFAFTTFPALAVAQTPGAGVPSWYVTAALAPLNASDAASLVVAATGYFSTPVAVNYANGTTPLALPLPLLAAGAGRALQAPECVTLIPSSASLAAAWFQLLVASVPATSTWVVSFQSARDALPDFAMACPCTAPLPVLQGYCDALAAYRGACGAAGFPAAACEMAVKSLGTLGTRDLFGQPREPLYSAVQAARGA